MQTILVADDDDSIRDLLITLLSEAGYVALSADNGAEAVEIAASHQPDLALLDVMMPVMNGFEACKAIKANPRSADIPVLLLTALSQTPSKVQGLDSGATDYITKPFDTAELLARLRSALLEKNRRDALAAEALTDPLTGVVNRRGLEQQLDQLMAHTDRANEMLSVMIFDADHFKAVNDTYGHETGDAVLSALARRAQETVRSQDVIGRLGGEEFLGILPGAGRESAFAAAERLRAHVADHPIDTATARIGVTVSVGVATAPPGMEIDRVALLASADRALYIAKSSGRNCVAHAEGQPTGPLTLPEPPESAQALVQTLALVHPPAAEHALAVSRLCWEISAQLLLPPAERSRVALAGLLHDVGILTVPRGVLDDTDIEEAHPIAALRQHADAGARLLQGLAPLASLADLVAAHHEHWDGSGYPLGLRQESIPLGSRIIAVADRYDRLCREQQGSTLQTARDTVTRESGVRFDPAVVTAALRVLPR